jgi:hypothetical protein
VKRPLVTYRTLAEADRAQLAGLLRVRQPDDAYLLHVLVTHGIDGFHGCFEDDALVGALWHVRGAVCAAAATTAEAARVLAARLRDRSQWGSVVGPDIPCSAVTAELSAGTPPRLDRVQTFMAAGRDAALGPDEPTLEPATADDVEELVPLVASYRVEDRLALAEDDHTDWIRAHVCERVRAGLLYVARDGGRIEFTGSFTYLGPAGGGLGGIYTVPERRGRGLAARAAAGKARNPHQTGPLVTNQRAPDNTPAQRFYKKARVAERGT